MVEQNPALIQPLLQQIAATNPALAQTVAQNPQALYDLLGAAMGGEMDDEDDGMGGQVMQIDLTQEEAAAVERVSGVSGIIQLRVDACTAEGRDVFARRIGEWFRKAHRMQEAELRAEARIRGKDQEPVWREEGRMSFSTR
jgi:UV excision repair protein RAD23